MNWANLADDIKKKFCVMNTDSETNLVMVQCWTTRDNGGRRKVGWRRKGLVREGRIKRS